MLSPKEPEIEIMSPAGSFESLASAIQAGAGSVYFGIEKLNMRSKSSINFTIDDLAEITRICKENKVKTYLTVNTIIYDEDIDTMKKIIDAALINDITAVIASDIATIQYCRSCNVNVHASTQLNISNIEALKFYARYCDVIVLARELNLNQVKKIHDRIIIEKITGPGGKPVRIEMFIHGALCMAVSGKCYLSLHEMNHSANRGQCLQTCRKAYIVREKESENEIEVDNEYIMSPKDLKTIHFLNKILDSGATVLKIEGRARSPEYVKTVTKCYREAVDSILESTYSEDKINNWNTKLEKVFNRGFWDGYYLGQKLGEWSNRYGSFATKRKVYIAKTTNYFSNLNVGEFLIETGSLDVGDEVLIIGTTTGVVETVVKEIRVDMKSVNHVKKGERCSIPIETLIRRSDKLYKLIDAEKSISIE
ncbi:MAG: peptidase U32 family protein [Bacteroidota bacterium]